MNSRTLLAFLRSNSLGRTIVALLALAFIALLATNVATYLLIQRMQSDAKQVQHTYDVQLTAQQLLTYGVDAESWARGYLLTNDPSYLPHYRRNRALIPAAIQRLKAMTADNPEQQARIDRLQPLFDERFDILDRVVEASLRGDRSELGAQIRAGRGRNYSEEVRSVMAGIHNEEVQLLVQREAASYRAVRITTGANMVGGVLILVAAVISVLLFRRYLGEIQASRNELDSLNAGLEETVRERTEDLVRANEEIQRFAYIVSHDLRSPLVNVMGYTSELQAASKALDRQFQVLEDKSPKLIDEEARMVVREDVPEAIGFIRASTAKMDGLINAILRLSREGRRRLTPTPLDLTKTIKAIAASVNHQVSEAGAEIKVDPLPHIVGDRVSIEQVFGNLVDNAVKYLDPERPGRIEVTGRDIPGGQVEITVADNGRGIAPKDHQRVFELFRRAGVQDRPGEGLGLAFVQNLVRRMGGVITLESELGKGSTFRVRLPKRLVQDDGGPE